MNERLGILVMGLCLAGAVPTWAGEADVVAVVARCDARSICRFAVTVEHADKGWKHFANRWEILGPDRAVLATRVLRHPHVGEQPFTRELTGVTIPRELRVVTVRAHDLVDGYGGREVEVELERPSEAPD